MIDALAVAQVFAAVMGCWALGFSMGKGVAYVRAIANAA